MVVRPLTILWPVSLQQSEGEEESHHSSECRISDLKDPVHSIEKNEVKSTPSTRVSLPSNKLNSQRGGTRPGADADDAGHLGDLTPQLLGRNQQENCQDLEVPNSGL